VRVDVTPLVKYNIKN